MFFLALELFFSSFFSSFKNFLIKKNKAKNLHFKFEVWSLKLKKAKRKQVFVVFCCCATFCCFCCLFFSCFCFSFSFLLFFCKPIKQQLYRFFLSFFLSPVDKLFFSFLFSFFGSSIHSILQFVFLSTNWELNKTKRRAKKNKMEKERNLLVNLNQNSTQITRLNQFKKPINFRFLFWGFFGFLEILVVDFVVLLFLKKLEREKIVNCKNKSKKFWSLNLKSFKRKFFATK